ncbi:protein kinase, partial [Acinetobacter baumannii]
MRRPLHVGSTADVYEAQHTSANRIVALKILHRNSTSLESRKFRDEARVIASIAQDHVVTLYDQGMTADKQEYQVMECLHG